MHVVPKSVRTNVATTLTLQVSCYVTELFVIRLSIPFIERRTNLEGIVDMEDLVAACRKER